MVVDDRLLAILSSLSVGDISAHFAATAAALVEVDSGEVLALAGAILETHEGGGTTFVCGNGGSAATASHFACDLQKAAGIRALALTDSSALITAWANDYSFDAIFSHQLTALARAGDLLVVISCSGASPNVVAAGREGEIRAGVRVAMMVGGNPSLKGWVGSETRPLAVIRVDSLDYAVIENCHLAICHAVTAALQHRSRDGVLAWNGHRLSRDVSQSGGAGSVEAAA